MTRRTLLLTFLSSSLIPKAFAISPSDFSLENNPGLSELFFKRFWKFHNENFFNHSQNRPPSLVAELMKQISEPNEYYMKLPNDRSFPRFQWVYEIVDGKLNESLVDWFNFDDPAHFRNVLRPFFPYLPKTDWCGLSWDVQKDTVTCHSLVRDISKFNPKVSLNQYESFGFQSQMFENKKRIAEEFTFFTKFAPDMITYRDGTIQFRRVGVKKYNVMLGQDKTVELRRRIAREFRVYESNFALSPDGLRQRLYYI